MIKEQVVPLTDAHDRTQFTSGLESVDRYFEHEAMRAHQSRSARTYVLEGTEDRVVGYFTITPIVVKTTGMRFSSLEASAYLLAKIGVRQENHGHGLGSRLLLAALGIVSTASFLVGGRALVLDPDAGVAGFYEEFGFEPVAATGRYWMSMSDLDAVLDALRDGT